MKSKRSAVLIIVLFLIAAILAGGLFYLLYTRDYDFHSQSSEAAQTPSPVEESVLPTAELETEPPKSDQIVISLIGDCTLTSSQYNTDYESYLLKNDFSWPFSGTVQYFENDSFTLANLECTFSDTPMTSAALFYFRAPTVNTAILTLGGVDCVTLANNHTNDFGAQGLADTQAALDAAKVSWIGPNDSKVFTTEEGLTIGVYCPGWNGLSETNIVNGIAALKSAGADLCIFAPHWGNEGSYQVTANQEAFARIAIDAGAQIVCGTHPHVLQRIEEYNGGYIFYSLGNWSFGGNTAPRDRDTAIAQIIVKALKDGSFQLTGYEIIPCSISSSAQVNDYRPVPYEADSADYARALSKLDGSFNGPDLTVDYSSLN